MKILSHILGFPRIGLHRELKKSLENYWNKKISKKDLLKIGYQLRTQNWKKQKKNGIDLLSVGDFAWYDHVLHTSLMLGNIPDRHKNENNVVDIDTLFRISRGCAPSGKSAPASEMTKWFNTNYHFIVPEFKRNQKFKLTWMQLFEEIDEALSLGYSVKPILLGPLTYLWLGKSVDINFDKLSLLNNVISVYKKIFFELEKRNIEWVQIDEPILVLELSQTWLKAFETTYNSFQKKFKILLTTYFDSIGHNLNTIKNLSVDGLHIDLVHGKDDINKLHTELPKNWIFSFGVVNGRNVWKTDLFFWYKKIEKFLKGNKRNLLISSSCSLLHSPVDLCKENKLKKEIFNWFSFSIQKCYEISILTKALNKNNIKNIKILKDWSDALISRNTSTLVHNKLIEKALKNISIKDLKRNDSYLIREKEQKKLLNLPILPTTTIGSFPQTKEIRTLRMNFKKNNISITEYEKKIKEHIKHIVKEQEILDIDVLVHGEVERNDMVEYFGENLNGFVFTQNGWVQSYGSRCVKPPIIIGDISRSKNITAKWSKYAQSLTKKPIKGMLTGPITILFWSFPREDISKEKIAKQIALTIRQEAHDLEKSGIKIIQIDEPAFREGLPLRKSDWKYYLNWAVNAFCLSSSIVKNSTQIHTHMCYCEFNDIIESIANLDADVITIETSRSNMELLESFKKFKYPNDIGPGVYDIHSPNIPSTNWIKTLLLKASEYIPINRLWVNPDCGLKTRNWIETKKALKNMVKAAKELRIIKK